MSNNTADGLRPRPRVLLSVASRLFVACLFVGLGSFALGSAPASADTGTQIVLSISGPLLVGHPATLIATIEDAGGSTVTSGTDSTAAVTFTNIGSLGTGTVTFATPSATVGGVSHDVVTGDSIGNDLVDIQASATLSGVLVTSAVFPASFDASPGIYVLKSCNGDTLIGQPYECQYLIKNDIDTAPDTYTITSIVDQVYADLGTVTSNNLLPLVTIAFTTGGATCDLAASLCTMPYGSTIETNPYGFYTVVPQDYLLSANQLYDTVTVATNNECNGGSANCSTAALPEQASAQTTVEQNTPSVSTALTPPSPVTVGTPVTDQATLSGASPSAGGTVSYGVYSNGSCTSEVASLGTMTVTAGSVGHSNPWTAIVGSYWFRATYSGDAGDIGPVSSSCASEPLTVVSPPGIGITKLPATQLVPPGGTATWTIVVTNTSSAVSLTDVTVVDPVAPTCARSFTGTLLAGASEPGYSCSLADVTTSFTNVATASGAPPVGADVTASAEAVVVEGLPGPIELYADPPATGGSDANNDCLLEAKPCGTIEHAIDEAAILAPNAVGAVINLSAGTFNSPTDTMFAGLGNGSNLSANNNLTITGDGTKTVVEPTSCSSLGEVTDPESPDNGKLAIVVFDAPDGDYPESINGVTVENLVFNGAFVAGGACPDYSAAFINTSGEDNAVVGNEIQSGATYGILTDDGANSTIISNILAPVLCSTTVTGPNTGLPAGWTSPANLKVKAVPTCAKFKEAGHGAATGVFINGIAYCTTTSATKANLVITGTPTSGTGCARGGSPITDSAGLEIATGATVVYNTSVAPFLQWGIACNSPLQAEDQSTDCAISDNTVTGGGTVYGDAGGMTCGGLPPVGIVATGGATATVDGNTVSGVTDTIGNCPEEGETTNDGVGIGLLPDKPDGCSAGPSVIGVDNADHPATGQGNTLGSAGANDNGIVVSGNVGATCSDSNPAYQVNGNTVSAGNRTGILLTNLGFGNGTLAVNEPMENNSVSSVTGPGIELQGVLGQAIGGPLASEGNSSTGNQEGLVLAPCVPVALHPLTPPGCTTYSGHPVTGGPESTNGNTIENNTMTGNVAFGVLAVGSFQPDEIAGTTSTALESSGNTFDRNNWGTPTSATNGTTPAEVNGAEVLDGTGWGGGCHSVPGDCPTTAGVGPLVFEGPNTTFSSSSPGSAIFSLSVCNSGTVADDLPVGTEVTLNGGQPDDGGTFFVTQAAIIAGVPSCTHGLANLSLQAIAPADVGTLESPSGQPYMLAPGDIVTVNANGSTVVPSGNTYGGSVNANSCTPAGAGATQNVFGAHDPPGSYSTTLDASTGGVNATYDAC
jgi:hypothetical protein